MRVNKILLVEDNQDDLYILKEVLGDELNKDIELIEAKDGQEAIDKIRKEAPNLIILDLNLPKVNGSEVLREVKKDENLKHIPVIIFSSSNAYSDVTESYKQYANAYLVKPYGISQLQNTLKAIKKFWIDSVVIDKNDGFRGIKE